MIMSRMKIMSASTTARSSAMAARKIQGAIVVRSHMSRRTMMQNGMASVAANAQTSASAKEPAATASASTASTVAGASQTTGRPNDRRRTRPRVCVLGGGFGGLYTALRLKSMTWPTSAEELRRSSRFEDLLPASAALRPPQLPTPVSFAERASSSNGTGNAADASPEVVLVDKSDRFIFKPLLYELLLDDAAVWEVCPRYEDLLAGSGIRFVRDEVTSVQPECTDETCDDGQGGVTEKKEEEKAAGVVSLRSGESIEYDWLVVALGAGPRATNVPGARENAIPFATLDHALKISTQLAKMQTNAGNSSGASSSSVVVVGGGVSGVEVASTIAQRLGRGKASVTILHGGEQLMEDSPEKQRDAAMKVLERRGVKVRTRFRVTSVEAVNDNASDERATGVKLVKGREEVSSDSTSVSVSTDEDEIVEAGLVVWTAGQAPVSGPLVDSFPKTDRGAVEIEPTLRVKGLPRVFAMGDVVVRTASGGVETAKPLPATAQVAFQQSDFAAWNIWSSINNLPLQNFRYQHLGDMMLLGSTDAAMTPLGIDGLTLDGPVAAAFRKVTYLYRMPTAGHAAKVGASWALRPILQFLSKRGY